MSVWKLRDSPGVPEEPCAAHTHTQHTREGFKETHSHTSSCSAYMSRGASSAAMDTEQRAGETAPSVRARAPGSEVFFVLIHNIIKIRIIHNTRRFPLYYATLTGTGWGTCTFRN